MIRFMVPGLPFSKGRPRFKRIGNFVSSYTDNKTRAAEAEFLKHALSSAPSVPLECPLKVSIKFIKIKPKGYKKSENFWYKRPDLDNMIKGLDALNGVFWKDDSQIISINAEKCFGDSNRTEVEIAAVLF